MRSLGGIRLIAGEDETGQPEAGQRGVPMVKSIMLITSPKTCAEESNTGMMKLSAEKEMATTT